jgi:hypothetical protein
MTVENIKKILNITSTTKDAQIAYLMPIVLESIINYCRNTFTKKDKLYLSSNDVTFTESTYTIDLNTVHEFQTGDFVLVSGTFRNNRLFKIDSTTSETLVVENDYVIKDETCTSGVYVKLVSFPRSVEPILAQMINYQLKGYGMGIKSEKIDDYSVAFSSAGNVSGYPSDLTSGLNDYRKVYRG